MPRSRSSSSANLQHDRQTISARVPKKRPQRQTKESAMPHVVDTVREQARTSSVPAIDWPNRGPAPRGYVEGMAVSFGRVYCKLKAGDATAVATAQAVTANPGTDALAHYAATFAALGLDNGRAGPDTLRHLFVLLMGLGMRESSGRLCGIPYCAFRFRGDLQARRHLLGQGPGELGNRRGCGVPEALEGMPRFRCGIRRGWITAATTALGADQHPGG
jgi:hypothetical protein